MNLVEQLGLIEAERDRLKHEVERLTSSRTKQAAVIEEYRGMVDRLERMIAKQAELIGTYKNHFHTFHGSADSIVKQEREIAQAQKPEPTVAVNSPEQVETIKSRVSRLARIMTLDPLVAQSNGNGTVQ